MPQKHMVPVPVRSFIIITAIATAVGILIGSALALFAPSAGAIPRNFPARFTVAELQALTCNDSPSRNGRIYTVLDPVDGLDCSVGLGIDTPHSCVCNGSSGEWRAAAPSPNPIMKLERNAVQSIASDTNLEFIVWDTLILDPDSWSDIGGPSPTEITADYTGTFQCSVGVRFVTSTTGKRVCTRAFVDGAPATPRTCIATADGDGTGVQLTSTFSVIPGSSLESEVWQNTGSAEDITAVAVCERKM